MQRGREWWLIEDAEECGRQVTQTVDDLRSRDEARRTAIRIWDDLYDGRTIAGIAGVDPYGILGRSGIEVPSVNVSRNIVDFIHAKVTAETPAVKADTHGGDWAQVRRAIKLSRFVEGLSTAVEVQERAPLAALQALRVGTGAIKVVESGRRLALEVVSAREFLVDPDDARHGDPRCLYQVKPVDPSALATAYPDLSDSILSTGGSSDPSVGGVADPWSLTVSDQSTAIDLYEAWCLPALDPDTGELVGGRHVMCVRGQTLIDEEWTTSRFPVAFLRPSDPRPGGGFWGQGTIERMVPLQWEINETIAAINKAERLVQLRVFIGDDSEIADEQLEDPAIGSVIRYKGNQVPVFHTPEGVNAQRIAWLKQLIDWGYSMFGMDEQSASSQRPAGINSGRAILYFNDFQTQRHVDLAKRYGRFIVDVVDRLLDGCARLDGDGNGGDPDGSPSEGKAFHPAIKLNFSDVQMDRDSFVLELEEVSSVPDTFAGRLQQMEQDVSEGRLPPDYLLQMRQDPDLERRWDAAMADGEFVDWAIEELLDDRNPMPPVLDEMDLQLAADRLRAEVQRSVMARADDIIVERLRSYAADVADAIAERQPPPQAPGPQQPEGPSPFTGGVNPAGQGQ